MPSEKNRFLPASDRLVRRAEGRLAAADPIMKRLIGAQGHCPLATWEYAPFHMLANSIISQQLSTKAAAAIKQRLTGLLPAPFAPEKFLQLSSEQLRIAGLSQAKTRYIAALAARVCEGRLVFNDISGEDDETVIAALSECPGIGRWTAEMFLIFALKRLDVLAVGDVGLQRAASLLYGKSRRSKNLLPRVAEAWRPYRSVASWYLWKSLERRDR